MLKVTYLGTTVLLFDDGKDQVLFDAHVTRPSISQYIKGADVSTNTALCDRLIALHHIDRLRAIFVSHTHHDHVMDAPYIAKSCGAKVFGSESARNVALGGGVPDEDITIFGHGDRFIVGDFSVSILKSLHSKPNKLNDDLGQPITAPLVQPASIRAYKNGGRCFLIRPSFNYIEGQLDGLRADVLFLGVAGLAKAEPEMERRFFEETVEKTAARLVIPIHWDNFFASLERPVTGMPNLIEDSELVFFKLRRYCEAHGVNFLIQYPRTSIEL